MNGKFQDLTGCVFGKLTVIGPYRKNKSNTKTEWCCLCECGVVKYIVADSLKRGYVKSCGNHFKEFAESRKTHGDSKTGERLYSIWKNMKSRCKAQSGPNYKSYTSKGITVCTEWASSYESFKGWALSHGYAPNLTLDRIDGTQGYIPQNCRWVTRKEQSNNISTNHLITYLGKTQSLTAWAEEVGLPPSCLESRLRLSHWPIEKALTTPKQR